jgi:hypothetical protein
VPARSPLLQRRSIKRRSASSRHVEEAADWGVKAAARPNAHAHILAIAALCLALAGRLDEAKGYLSSIHKTRPGYRIDDFLTAMQLASDGESLFRDSAKRIGMS